jgi:hypothetical protein
MADAWPASQALGSVIGDHSLSDWLQTLLLFAPVQPLLAIRLIFHNVLATLRFRKILTSSTNPELGPDTMSMSNKLRRVKGDILVMFFGINQARGFLKRTRIVANTYIVLGMSHSTTLPSTHNQLPKTHIDTDDTSDTDDTDDSPVEEDKMADALTLGHKTAENSCLMELNEAGKLALLESSILPHYKQLRFVDGRSGIATLIIAVQALGYVTSIVYRAIHHLPVSPIEAIGFAFSMLVIVHSVVHSVGVICQNPLVIYLNPAQEQEMLDLCKSTRWSYVDGVFCANVAMVGTVVVGSVVVAFTILVEWHVLRISWLDAIGPVLFLVCLITQLFSTIIFWRSGHSTWETLLGFGNGMISFGGIVVSIVATIVNWQTNKFDSRTPSVIHNLPFLG